MTYQANNQASSATNFGSYLRHLRLQARLNQRDLAIAVGYSESQISRLEQNQRLPDLSALRARFLPALQLEEESDVAAQLLQLACDARQPNQEPATELGLPLTPGANILPIPTGLAVPTPLTSLINRGQELLSIDTLLEQSSTRLLTLIGPPGIGKTRLSLQIASAMRQRFRDGAWFVPLAPVRDPALVLPTIAQTLGLPRLDDQALAAALHTRHMLLILDNFEQVVDAAPRIAELLRMAPELTILVTSRAALQINGEQQFPVPPLELPDPEVQLRPDTIAHYPAIRLFVERMRAVRPHFELTDENAASVVDICTRLDGIPLAIELAAARGKLFTPQILLDRLCGPDGTTTLQFLVDGPRDLPDHQRTLRSAIDWSYDLLTDDARTIFAHMAVFAGGMMIDAIQAICAIPQPAIEEALAALANQSLVTIAERNGQMRFHLLETMREYGQEKLSSAGILAAIQQRHAEYYVTLVQSAAPYLRGERQEEWLNQLETEQNNLRTALSWWIEHDLTIALECAVQLRAFWFARGYFNEGRAWLSRMIGHPAFESIATNTRAAALCTAGYLAYHQGDHPQAESLSNASLVLWRALQHPLGIAQALINLGGISFLQADYPRAIVIYEECLATFRTYHDPHGIAQSLRALAHIAKDQGELAQAAKLHHESLNYYQQVGDIRGVCSAQINLSIVSYWLGDYPQARKLVEAALPTLHVAKDLMGIAYALDQIGMIDYKQGKYRSAQATLNEGLLLFRKLGDQIGVALTLTDLGRVLFACGDNHQAWKLHHEGLTLALKLSDKRRAAFCLEGLATTAGDQDPQLAARLFGAASALRHEIGTPLPPSEQSEYMRDLAHAQAACSAEVWAREWAIGIELPLSELV